MKSVSGKEMCKALEQKGWVLKRIKSSHHIYAKEGHQAIISVPVHANRSLKKGLLRDLMKVAELTEDDF